MRPADELRRSETSSVGYMSAIASAPSAIGPLLQTSVMYSTRCRVSQKDDPCLLVRLITLHSGGDRRSEACCEAMLQLRDMLGPSDCETLPGDGARPLLHCGSPAGRSFRCLQSSSCKDSSKINISPRPDNQAEHPGKLARSQRPLQAQAPADEDLHTSIEK